MCVGFGGFGGFFDFNCCYGIVDFDLRWWVLSWVVGLFVFVVWLVVCFVAYIVLCIT